MPAVLVTAVACTRRGSIDAAAGTVRFDVAIEGHLMEFVPF
jgi:hypothetical protein